MAPSTQHPVPPEVLTRIGDIVVSFALLENAVETLTGSLILEHQRVGQIITAELSFAQTRGLLVSLYRERHGEDDDYARLAELMRGATAVEQRRNEVVHSIWAAGGSPDTVTRVRFTAKVKHGWRVSAEPISVNDLAQTAEAIRELAAEIQHLQLDLIERRKIEIRLRAHAPPIISDKD